MRGLWPHRCHCASEGYAFVRCRHQGNRTGWQQLKQLDRPTTERCTFVSSILLWLSSNQPMRCGTYIARSHIAILRGEDVGIAFRADSRSAR